MTITGSVNNYDFDKDAIAVYAEGKKIGFVANKNYTKFGTVTQPKPASVLVDVRG